MKDYKLLVSFVRYIVVSDIIQMNYACNFTLYYVFKDTLM